jgi:hypothetical protein
MSGRNFYNGTKSSVPGPGQYNNMSQTHLHKNPTWRMGTSTRDDMLKRIKRENIPGPGNYVLKVNKSTPLYSFGTERRDKVQTNSTPGPGHYHIPCSMVDVPRYLMNQTFDSRFKYI